MLAKDYRKYFLNNKKTKIIDIGCGISPVSPNVRDTIFIESDKNAVKILKNLGYNSIEGDICDIPLNKDFADAIFCSEVLEHVPDYKKAIKEFFRVLKKDGLLLITVPIHKKYWAFDDDYVGHLRRFNPDKLAEELKDNKFDILNMKPIGSFVEREITKLMVRMAMNQKGTGKMSNLKIKLFGILNQIFFGISYLGYLFNNKNNSSIIMIACKK